MRIDMPIGHYEIDIGDVEDATAAYRYLKIGAGLFRVHLSLFLTGVAAVPYTILFRYKDSKGVEHDIYIDSGFTDNRNRIQLRDIEFEGPGKFVAYALPIYDSGDNEMSFAGYVRRVQS